MSDGIVIIGAGYAGVSAAFSARAAGFDAPITVIGDDPAWPYERPPLSKWEDHGPIERPIFAPDQYAEQSIDLLRGETATLIAPEDWIVELKSGSKLGYAKLLLATGARARSLGPALPAARPIHTLRSLADARTIWRSVQPGEDVLIIGGGFIGLELAASLRARRVFVHVVEAQDRILARALPADISERVHALHVANGIMVHPKCTIGAFEDDIVYLSNGHTVRADHVIVGVGSKPNTELASAAGLRLRNGILVDASFATSASDIFAAGDCCAAPVGAYGPVRQESWAVAGDQGRRAGQIMAGVTPDAAEPPWFWSDHFDEGLQVVGIPVPDLEIVKRKTQKGGLICAQFAPDGRILWAAGIAPAAAIGRDIAVIKKLMLMNIAVPPEAFTDAAFSLKSLLRERAAQC